MIELNFDCMCAIADYCTSKDLKKLLALHGAWSKVVKGTLLRRLVRRLEPNSAGKYIMKFSARRLLAIEMVICSGCNRSLSIVYAPYFGFCGFGCH